MDIAQEKSTELYNEMLKTIKKLSEHENTYIRETTNDRINMIQLDLSQIKTSKGLDKNKESWKTRCKTEIGCIIS